MTWIETIPQERASGRLKTLYDRIAGPSGRVDNILTAHALRPHTLEGHMVLYKAVLHHASNRIDGWLLESIGIHVSLLNECGYCVEHHFAGLRRLLADDVKADRLRSALEAGTPEAVFDDRAAAALDYAGRLTTRPAGIEEGDIERLRAAGFDDGEILEINQVASYFAYANRVVLGLGVDTRGDVPGLSPGNASDSSDWHHG
jgi:uncharacterized peroxidase-related enzyme